MPVFKIVHLFDTPIRPDGWSETWYVQANDFPDATNKGTMLANARIKLLNSSYVLHYLRVSSNIPQIPKPPRRTRAAGLTNLSLPGGAGVGVGASQGDLPWTCALLRVSDATLSVFRNFLCRGVNDNLWDLANDKLAKAFFAGQLPAFTAALVANSALILHKQALPPPLNPVFIQSVQYERMAKRSTGRPFGLDRGRR